MKVILKKAYWYLLIALIMAAFSCASGGASNQETDTPEAVSAPAEETPDVVADASAGAGANTDNEEYEEYVYGSINKGVGDFDLLAEVNIEEKPLAEDEASAGSEAPFELDEPKVPVLAVEPEPEPEPLPPQPEVVIVPPAPVVTPPPPPPAPPRVTTPPPTPTPPPPAPAVTPPPADTTPPPPPAPPAIAREPVPREEPELPYPIGGISASDDRIIFSRVVRATVGQLVEIPFRGTNWVYLGEAASRRGITYDSRRLDLEGQSFVFRTETAGEYTLKFFRQDFVRDFILNDYVQVVVGNPPETAGTGWFNPPIDRGRVIAEPRWPTSLAEAEARKLDGTQPQAGGRSGQQSETPPALSPESVTGITPQVTPNPPPPITPVPAAPPIATLPPQTPIPAPTVTPPAPVTPPPVQVTPAAPPAAAEPPAVSAAPPVTPPATEIPADIVPEAYLDKAKEEFDAGRIDMALSYLDRFREHFPLGSDELWWLYGQFYEANGPQRDILTSLECYRRLTSEYPQSSRYDDARRRIAYLQRYYININ